MKLCLSINGILIKKGLILPTLSFLFILDFFILSKMKRCRCGKNLDEKHFCLFLADRNPQCDKCQLPLSKDDYWKYHVVCRYSSSNIPMQNPPQDTLSFLIKDRSIFR